MSPLIQALRRRGRPPVVGLFERRREQILSAATDEFARQGYAGTDLQIVADRLRVGKGTVYRYFPTKKELFLAAADRGMRLLNARVNSQAAGTPDLFEKIIRAVHEYLRFFDEHPEFVELIVLERAQFRDRERPTYFAHQDVNIGPWKTLLRSLIDAGEIRRIPVDRITNVFSAALYGTIFTNYFEGRRRPPVGQAREILDIMFHGFVEAGGRWRFSVSRKAGRKPRVTGVQHRGDGSP